MRVLNITKCAFCLILFCLINIFTVVVSNDNVFDNYNNTTFGYTQNQSSLILRNNETSFLENPLVNNHHTAGFDVINRTILPSKSKNINYTLVQAAFIANIASTTTDNLYKILIAQSYNNDISVVNFNLTSHRIANISIILDSKSNKNDTERLNNLLIESCSKTLLLQYQNLQNLSIINLNKSNRSDHDLIITENLQLAEKYFQDNIRLHIDHYQAFKTTFCEQIIQNAKKSFLMKLDKNLEEAVEYCNQNERKKLCKSIIEFPLTDIFRDIYEEKTIVLPETIQKSCKNEKFFLVKDILLTNNHLTMKILQNLKIIYNFLLKNNEFIKYGILEFEYAQLLQTIQEKQ